MLFSIRIRQKSMPRDYLTFSNGLVEPICNFNQRNVFARDKVTYLEFELPYRGIEASPDKVKAVQIFPKRQSVNDVRSFLSVASFYRRLVPHFCDTAKALTLLTKKDNIWEWNQECQESFDKLKSK